MTPTPGPTSTVAPIVREVVVATDRATAFALFTEHIGSWWPMASHSVFGEHATVAFEDGRLVERAGDSHTVWGDVLAWDAPKRFAVTWHPGVDPAETTEVEVAFSEHEDGTLVRLTHSGWERRAEDVRTSYGSGWVFVLDRFVEAVPGADVTPGS